MGHYTIRTSDDEDCAIRKAQKRIGEASVSKAFMAAIMAYPRHKDEIAQLREALAQEEARNRALIASVQQFRTGMDMLFQLADD